MKPQMKPLKRQRTDAPAGSSGLSTQTRQIGSITLCCMAPDYRDCLDAAMDGWMKHKAKLPKKVMGKHYRPGVYAFAYWLIRWSGLVTPCNENPKK
jgi:hypothetical protein